MNPNEDFNDPKNQGVPPPYTQGPPPNMAPPPPQGYPHTAYVPGVASVGVVYQANAPTVMPVVVAPRLGAHQAAVTCRSCNQPIITRVERKSSTKTHLFALLLCIVFWPCVCLPYCIDSCQDADHYCPNCNAYVGKYTS